MATYDEPVLGRILAMLLVLGLFGHAIGATDVEVTAESALVDEADAPYVADVTAAWAAPVREIRAVVMPEVGEPAARMHVSSVFRPPR
jgi:hypothetical protein